MRFYNRQPRHYCGIDLHVKAMYVCILDAAGQVLVHRNVKSTPEAFLETVAPYRDDLVVAAERMFTWYWLADLCAAQGIQFVLGHALAMKAIHGGKAKKGAGEPVGSLEPGPDRARGDRAARVRRRASRAVDREPQVRQRARLMGRPLSSRPCVPRRCCSSPEPGDNGRAWATSLVMRRRV